jgi:hypothetical protein
MIKSLRDLTLTLARAKLYYNRTVLRVIPPPIFLARAIGERTWSERAFLGERGHVGASSGILGRAGGGITRSTVLLSPARLKVLDNATTAKSIMVQGTLNLDLHWFGVTRLELEGPRLLESRTTRKIVCKSTIRLKRRIFRASLRLLRAGTAQRSIDHRV